jgi:two-component system, OmpR family, heavy metal sensor histidine kinase CusS
MPRRSIRFRLTVWYATVLTAGLGLFSGLIWLSLRHRLIGEIDRDLEGRASRFEQYFRTESAEGAAVQLGDELDEFCQALPPSSYVYLAGANGFVFRYPTAAPPVQSFRMLRRQFTSGGEVFDLEMGAAAGDVLHTLDLLRLLLLSLIPVVIAIACMGGAWLSGRALKPVHDLTAAALTISIENLSERLPVPSTGDELARLTEVWNSMLQRLETAVKTLSQFVADASHELRTPLAVIRTTAELALRRARSPEAYRESLQEIVAESERMTQLVEDLLLLARSDTGSVEMPLAPVDAREVVREVCAEMRGLAELRGIRITEPPGEGTAMISGNRPALHRLFLVLLDNALKYSPAGGDVNITVERKDSLVSIAIEDFGPGISDADLPHIFKRFYRADLARSDVGHGLGLSLAESIARTHGASIEVRRTEKASTIFRVEFTWRDGRPALPPFSQPSASPATINAAHASTKGVQHT